MEKNKISFKLDVNGNELDLAVLKPDRKRLDHANKVRVKAFREALDSKFILRAKVDSYVREQNLWDDTKEKEVTEINKRITENEKNLIAGKKIGLTKEDGYKLALDIRKDRQKLRDLRTIFTDLDTNTVESQADNVWFNHLVSACLVYNDTGKPYFKDLDDYLGRSDEKVAVEAAKRLMELLFNTDLEDSKLIEDKFLKKYGYVDNKFRLVNKDGHLIDESGNLIDENGRFVNENNEFVDRNGNRVDEEGNLLVDFDF